MKKYKAIIIDDEPRARALLKGMLEELANDIEIVAESTDLPNGVKSIRKLNPDLIFLDIEMPGHSGLELLDFFNEDEVNFDIVFTTAYSNYAIQAFKLSAIDYLTKPIEAEEIIETLKRFRKKHEQHPNGSPQQNFTVLKENLKRETDSRIAVPSGNSIRFIELSEILFLKGEGSYTEMNFTDNTKLIVSRTLKNFEESIGQNKTLTRCHKSYIVNTKYIKEYVKSDGGYLVLNNGQHISISPDRVEEILKISNFVGR
jgi:two-component system, LytTR family, response regulator